MSNRYIQSELPFFAPFFQAPQPLGEGGKGGKQSFRFDSRGGRHKLGGLMLAEACEKLGLLRGGGGRPSVF